jgi:uncharacterized protein (TIGR03083 family)
MGMNPDTAPEPDEDVALHVLDAATADDDERSLEIRLTTDPSAARWERRLRDVVTELGAAAATDAPPPSLRRRILTTAQHRRPGVGPVSATAPELHAIELERALTVLRDLDDADWSRRLDPPELDGWTVHDLAAHLAGNESLLAANLGHPVPGIPETAAANEERTAATQARHRTMTPAETIAELEAAVAAVADAVGSLDASELATDIDWWGLPTSIRTTLIIRAFETWTHTDDIRRALGLAHLAPPAPSLSTMGRSAAGWMPLMLVASGVDLPDRPVRLHLTGPGGGSFDIDLAIESEVLPAGSLEPIVELTMDLVEFCRATGNRVPADGLTHTAHGDLALARQLVDAIPALAAL